LRLAGPRDIVELGERIGLAEIVAVIAEQRAEAVERETRLLARSLGRDDADFGPLSLFAASRSKFPVAKKRR
jgi:hypothetical protein